ncbi:MAG TPA: GNAT family N-acetyltransferase [Rudaea sp.]|nr:GNAT family N-acetyltransferase [Rudaea sp.]
MIASVHVQPRSPAEHGSQEMHWKEVLRDGTSVLIRPIHGEDAGLERRFIERLSPEARRLRFLGEIKTPSAAMIDQLTHPQAGRDAAFVALIADGAEKREIGVARFSARPDNLACECAVVVSDEWRGRGLATVLMRHLIDIARQRGIECMYSVDLAGNHGMQELAAHLGFQRKADPDDASQVLHTLDLKAATV